MSMVGSAQKLYRSSLVAAVAAALILGATPGHAVTCQEVRALTHDELVYWAKRLELKPEKLAVLLRKAFCEAPSGRPPDIDLFASRR
jgi:hypothetical protein